MTNGRQKGNTAEREVARMIQTWWAGSMDAKAKFVRTPLSGGWGTAQVRTEFRASGDLMTTSYTWPWCVEIKRREGWKLSNVISGEKSPIWEWWAQTTKAAEEAVAEPMLWFRKNQEPWFVMLDAHSPTTKAIELNNGYTRIFRPDGAQLIMVRASEMLALPASTYVSPKA